MTERVLTVEVRPRIGDMLNRVALRHDEFVIERKGRPLAALFPIERLEQIRRFARHHAIDTRAMNSICRDADDDAVLGAHVEGRATVIVTDDAALLTLSAHPDAAQIPGVDRVLTSLLSAFFVCRNLPSQALPM